MTTDLRAADLELESPWTFTLRSTGRREHKTTHGGVVEFIAEEGNVYLPGWMMRMLELQEGDPIHVQGTRLPKGKFVKLQPQTVDFLEISDPKAVLEQALRNYPTLTPGDIIEISYNCLTFEILIMEVVPDAEGISIIETDLEVDFAPPKGYVEPAPQQRTPEPTMASRMQFSQDKYDAVRPAGSHDTTPFKGIGETLSGKKTKGKKDKPITPHDPASRVRRTEYVACSHAAARRSSATTRSSTRSACLPRCTSRSGSCSLATRSKSSMCPSASTRAPPTRPTPRRPTRPSRARATRSRAAQR